MPNLCANRPEGFGPSSSQHPRLPTSCFLDTVVIPLPTWIYLLFALLILLPTLLVTHMRSRSSKSVPKSSMFNPEDATSADARRPAPRWVVLTLRILYYFLVVATIAMISLEIARLESGDLGIGLLPFEYVGVVAVAAAHTWLLVAERRRRQGKGRGGGRLRRAMEQVARWMGVLFWVAMVVVWALKIAAYVMEGVNSRDGRVPEEAYSVTDEVTDLGVMVLLVLILAIFEGVGVRGIA